MSASLQHSPATPCPGLRHFPASQLLGLALSPWHEEVILEQRCWAASRRWSHLGHGDVQLVLMGRANSRDQQQLPARYKTWFMSQIGCLGSKRGK